MAREQSAAAAKAADEAKNEGPAGKQPDGAKADAAKEPDEPQAVEAPSEPKIAASRFVSAPASIGVEPYVVEAAFAAAEIGPNEELTLTEAQKAVEAFLSREVTTNTTDEGR